MANDLIRICHEAECSRLGCHSLIRCLHCMFLVKVARNQNTWPELLDAHHQVELNLQGLVQLKLVNRYHQVKVGWSGYNDWHV